MGSHLVVAGRSAAPVRGIAVGHTVFVATLLEELGSRQHVVPGGGHREVLARLGLVIGFHIGLVEQVFAIDEHLGITFSSHAIVALAACWVLAICRESRGHVIVHVNV